MNGRLYDPILGRMLSPDNNVQMPDFTQNYNRYSYVLNNPLKYNDPSGEVIPLLIGAAIIGGVANIGVGLLTGQVNNVGDALYYGFTGALVGVASAATGGAALAASGYAGASMIGGAISGAVGGAVGGGLQGATNAIYQKAVYGKHVEPAKEFLKGAVLGAIIGGVIGGAVGGYRANKFNSSNSSSNQVDIFTGIPKNPGSKTGSFGTEPGLIEFEDYYELGELKRAAHKVGSLNNDIALGVHEYLDDFASKVNGSTWQVWGKNDFQNQFLTKIQDPFTKIHFNLDGIKNPWSAVSEGAKGFGISRATPWELYQIYSRPEALGRTIFYQGGKIIPNPFQ